MKRKNSLSSSTWSQLPVELLKEVVLCAVLASTRDALNMRLVSRYFNSCILPILFRHVCLQSTEDILQFAGIISPKRRCLIPALNQTPPRSLDLYSISSLALTTIDRRPSIETALERVATVFLTIDCLAITAQNLSSHAFWIRQHAIRPRKVMILHFGRPAPVNYREYVFSETTHLFTSILYNSLYNSSIEDLSNLTHLAVHCQTDLAEYQIRSIAEALYKTLTRLPQLQRLVLARDDYDGNITSLSRWASLLKKCMADKRFVHLPYFSGVFEEWHDIVAGENDIWSRAEAWSRLTSRQRWSHQSEYMIRPNKRVTVYRWRLSNRKENWDLDMVAKEDYQEPAMDPARRMFPDTIYPH